jgi:hypothetical protein
MLLALDIGFALGIERVQLLLKALIGIAYAADHLPTPFERVDSVRLDMGRINDCLIVCGTFEAGWTILRSETVARLLRHVSYRSNFVR